MKYISLLFIVVFFIACSSKSKVEQEIEAIPMDVSIMRFDKEFAAVTPDGLAELRAKYPVFFPKQFHDSIWMGRMTDSLQQELNKAVQKQFPSDVEVEDQLYSLFQHIKYYFPAFKSPTIVTTTSDVDYQNKAIAADSLLVLSLDTYLGADHPFYEGIQKYNSKNLKPSQIPQDVAKAYAHQLISKPRQRVLLSQMIFYGKELYLKDLWLPRSSDAEKIGYTDEEMRWVEENEVEMWKYFVENEILYSTDPKLPARFINPAPFSKFYLEIDNQSPGMVGRYLGWQIVRSYMEKNPVTVQQLMIATPEDLFAASKYKPKKK